MKSPRPFNLEDLATLPLVEMVSAGAPIHAGQVHRAWSAMVQTRGSTDPAIPVVLKWMPSRVKIAVELGCSLAACALGLQVPRGMLVLAHPGDLMGLPSDASTLPGRADLLCFGSVLRWTDTARARDGDPQVDEYLWQRFCETATAAPGAAWDELIANADRHAGNFIFDGQRYWLIDHELALRPLADAIKRITDASVRSNIRDHRANGNQAATQLLNRRPSDHGMLAQPRSFESKTKTLELLAGRMARWRTGISGIDDVISDSETIVRGIILRLPALALQLGDRIKNPSSALLWTTKNA